MPHDEYILTMQPPDEVMQLLGEQSILPGISKKLYIPPKLILLREFTILNNASGGGDGDAALAHS